MTNSEIYENLHKYGGIYGYMYGERQISIIYKFNDYGKTWSFNKNDLYI